VLYFIDIERGYRSEFEMTIHILKTDKGVHKAVHHKGNSVSGFAKIIMNYAIAELSKQIIFDKCGFGIAVYDEFKRLIDRSDQIGMMDNGMLYAKPHKGEMLFNGQL
jgi:hypothetical protein